MSLLREVVKALDEAFFQSRPAGWTSKEFEEREIKTAAGSLTFSRRIYVNQFSGERQRIWSRSGAQNLG